MNITATSLKHPTTIGKIDQAMREALKASRAARHEIGSQAVLAASGRELLAVVHDRHAVPAFSFWTPDLKNITPVVLKALRASVGEQ